ncbi:ABC transporter ATP-binding protein [Sciscionella sediminilitoris]|uniref:ABC transporter ATP-binding protein n=1 Tax=Sciscionella sediminilitoris TaxID=1445613 RepID=UPI0004DFB23F|nr:ABC transporter ATP-binding protein [Sciscionella sp. SE31]
MSERLPVATGKQTASALRELLRGNRFLAAAALGALLVSTAVGLAVAPLLGRLVDLVAAHRAPSALVLPITALAVVAVARGLTSALGAILTSKLGETMLARLRERFVARTLDLPLETVERAGSGDLTARVTNDVALVGETVREGLPQLAQAVLTIVLTFGGLGALDWRFLLVALIAVPLQLHTLRWYLRHAVPLYARQRVASGDTQQSLLDTVGGASTVRAFGLSRGHTEKVAGASWSAAELMLRGMRLVTRFYGRLNLAEFIGLGAILVMGFFLVRADAVTIGATTAAALYFHSLFNPINVALALVDDAQAAAASLARLVGVVDIPETAHGESGRRPGGGTVKTSALHHSYASGPPVLHDVHLDIAEGERVAIVGASGAGKTTLATIIAGVHTPAGGSVLLGGVPLEELSPDRLRASVALISQEVHVFSGTLAEDLRLAKPSATDAELRAALDRVGAADWAQALEHGLDTVVGDGAHRLTTTQAQQLALARLLLVDPPIAILDEATAEAGSAGSRVLERAAEAALHGRTALIVAHRLTQAAAADRIIVLDAGRVVQTGTHAELSTADGPYAKLWAAWSDNRN